MLPSALSAVVSLIPRLFRPDLVLTRALEARVFAFYEAMDWNEAVDTLEPAEAVAMAVARLQELRIRVETLEWMLEEEVDRFRPVLQLHKLVDGDTGSRVLPESLSLYEALFTRVTRNYGRLFVRLLADPTVDGLYKFIIFGVHANWEYFTTELFAEYFRLNLHSRDRWSKAENMDDIFSLLTASELHLLLGRGANKRQDEELQVAFLAFRTELHSREKDDWLLEPQNIQVAMSRALHVPVEVNPQLQALCAELGNKYPQYCVQLNIFAETLRKRVPDYRERLINFREHADEVHELVLSLYATGKLPAPITGLMWGFSVDFGLPEKPLELHAVYDDKVELLEAFQVAGGEAHLRDYWPFLERMLLAETRLEQAMELVAVRTRALGFVNAVLGICQKIKTQAFIRMPFRIRICSRLKDEFRDVPVQTILWLKNEADVADAAWTLFDDHDWRK